MYAACMETKFDEPRLAINRVYTRQGDAGETSLAGGQRVPKDSLRTAAVEFDQMKEKIKYFMPSRLFIYYNERAMEGTVNSDSGVRYR